MYICSYYAFLDKGRLLWLGARTPSDPFAPIRFVSMAMWSEPNGQTCMCKERGVFSYRKDIKIRNLGAYIGAGHLPFSGETKRNPISLM